MKFAKTFAAAAVVAIAATSAFAKGHDQSNGADGEPGKNAGAETATSAQGLGAAVGNGQDKGGMDRGSSADAGKPSKD
ncbi:hypothetical protein ABMC89_13570 [Sulfitobacter sp. HNIBRBA3233]|uniref:hypothetical protein n=1 Tax=Sulfitobacter marinivivus TaxID=3158558 RepID=UPI0032E044CA